MPDNEILNNLNKTAQELLFVLADHAYPVSVKYAYYNATQPNRDIGIALPKAMKNMKVGVGWATRAVNTLGDRLNFDGFANDTLNINSTMDRMGAFKALGKAKTDAIIAGCSFVAISGEGDRYHITPFSAQEATGIIDENTGLLVKGIAVTEWYTYNSSLEADRKWGKLGLVPKNYTLFTSDYTVKFENRQIVEVRPNATGRPLLHVLTHRQSADRPFGKARVSNTVRRIVDEVGRLKVRYEIAAEFYSTPQRYINGLMQGATKDPDIDSQIGKVWAITKDDDGDKPEIGQLAQMTISQFSEQKKDLARDFCAETALTLRNLGYETSNPTSAESLSAMSDDLLLEAQECQDELGGQFKDIAISLLMAENGIREVPDEARALKPSWKPIFQLDLGAAGDALYKLFEIMPELEGTTTAYRMLGMSMSEAEELAARKANTRSSRFMQTEEQA